MLIRTQNILFVSMLQKDVDSQKGTRSPLCLLKILITHFQPRLSLKIAPVLFKATNNVLTQFTVIKSIYLAWV